MGERVEIINEYWSRSLLERDDLDYDKFYRRQIEEFLDVSRKDTKKYKKLYEEELRKREEIVSYMTSCNSYDKDIKGFCRDLNFKDCNKILEMLGSDPVCM